MPAHMTVEDIKEMPGGREMDALIAEKVLGRPFRKPTHGHCCTCQNCGEDHDACGGYCYYSNDITSAWQVVEKMPGLALHHIPDADRWNAYFHGGMSGGNTAPLAICRAALIVALFPEKETSL